MQAIYRGYRVIPDGRDTTATDEDFRAAREECTSFPDFCAAEAERGRWFSASYNREHSQRICILAAVREIGQATANDAAIRARLYRWQAEKAMRRLLLAGEVRVVGKRDHARVYEAVEVNNG